MPGKAQPEEDKMLELEMESPEAESSEGDEGSEEELFSADLSELEGGEGEDMGGESEASSMSDEELLGEITKRGLLRKMKMEE